MIHRGRPVIRLGDRTDHGGTVTAVSSGTVVMGREAELAGDMTVCPQCRGQFPIAESAEQGARHQGRAYVFHGDRTACGATLIASSESGSAAKVSSTE